MKLKPIAEGDKEMFIEKTKAAKDVLYALRNMAINDHDREHVATTITGVNAIEHSLGIGAKVTAPVLKPEISEPDARKLLAEKNGKKPANQKEKDKNKDK